MDDFEINPELKAEAEAEAEAEADRIRDVEVNTEVSGEESPKVQRTFYGRGSSLPFKRDSLTPRTTTTPLTPTTPPTPRSPTTPPTSPSPTTPPTLQTPTTSPTPPLETTPPTIPLETTQPTPPSLTTPSTPPSRTTPRTPPSLATPPTPRSLRTLSSPRSSRTSSPVPPPLAPLSLSDTESNTSSSSSTPSPRADALLALILPDPAPAPLTVTPTTSVATPSPKTTPVSIKKRFAPKPPSRRGSETIQLRESHDDPSLDIEKPSDENDRKIISDDGRVILERTRNTYRDDVDPEFQFDTLSRASSEVSTSISNLKFRKVTFKDFTKRGFLVPTWFVGILQMTVGIATAILAIAEILVPTSSVAFASGVERIHVSPNLFTLKKFNIFGLSVISSMILMVAGSYLFRAQAKNDLYVIKQSAGYALMSTLFHIGTLGGRLFCLWTGIISPSTIGIQMFVASLCIIMLTIFGFWCSALGFGVYALYVHNHSQQVESPQDLFKESAPVLDLIDRYMGMTT